MPLSSNYLSHNVEELEDKPDSILSLYQESLRLRKNSPALVEGYLTLLEGSVERLTYDREIPGEKIGVFLNFPERENQVEKDLPIDKILYSDSFVQVRDDFIFLPPFGAAIIRCKLDSN